MTIGPQRQPATVRQIEAQTKAVERELVEAMEQFASDLQSGKPIKATRVTRHDTPDGPMHTFEEVEI